MKKVFSGVDDLPRGKAKGPVSSGCLVLEGGAFRGLYTSGVLDAWMEAKINLSCVVGVSAGALNGMNYVSRQIGRSARVNLRYRHDSRYVGVKAYARSHGVIGFDFVLDEVSSRDPWDVKQFNDPAVRFIAVATSCRTGKPMYYEKATCGDILQAIRASASMPYVSRMVDVDGEPCLDGGCSVKIPYQWAYDQGCEKVVIVRTRPAAFRREIHEHQPLPDRFYHSWPKLAASLKASDAEYNRACDEIQQLGDAGKAFVVYPSVTVPVSRLEGDMEKLGHLYYLGYEDGKRSADALKRYLKG